MLSALALALAAGPVGCGGGTESSLTAAAPAERYTLRSGDRVRVVVFGEPELSGEVQLDGAGSVTLPLTGPVALAGLTAPQAEARLTAALHPDYLRAPQVRVEVVDHRPLYVLGEVVRPGAYPYSAGLSVLEAVALAGGFTYRAREGRMTVLRRDARGTHELDAVPTTPLLPGDTLRIHQRFF
jgi:polysaccharide export outer membrane protein